MTDQHIPKRDEPFESMLAGGHPNSLGRTLEVVGAVCTQPDRFEELFNTYQSPDPVVRLRTSNAMRRIEALRHDLLVPYLDRFLTEIAPLDQASAQWTLAVLFDLLKADMTPDQHALAQAVMQRNLAHHDDWIVLNNTMETLTNWAITDAALQAWLMPHLARLQGDPRKSVASRAAKFTKLLSGSNPRPTKPRQILP